MFKAAAKINFFDADPAGIMFFGKAFEYFHSSYESFLKELQPEENYFNHPVYAVPIKKAEAEYFLPAYPGETIIMAISVTEVRNSSFSLESVCKGEDDEVKFVTRTVHVFIDKKTGRKTDIPQALKTKLNLHIKEN